MLRANAASQTDRREAWLQEGRAGWWHGVVNGIAAGRGTHPAVSVRNSELRGMSQVTPHSDGTANTSSTPPFGPAWFSCANLPYQRCSVASARAECESSEIGV